MIRQERLLSILHSPHVSEKSSNLIEKNDTFVIKVDRSASKLEIKYAVQQLFEVQVETVNTLIVRGKAKRYKKHMGYRKNWKKAYVTLKKGQSLDFVDRNE